MHKSTWEKNIKEKITKNVLLTFANKGKCSMLRSDNETRSGEIILDLFESILFLALQHGLCNSNRWNVHSTFANICSKDVWSFTLLPFVSSMLWKRNLIVHLVFEKVYSPSIKDCERSERSKILDRTTNYQITRPEQRTPSTWLDVLRNNNFRFF